MLGIGLSLLVIGLLMYFVLDDAEPPGLLLAVVGALLVVFAAMTRGTSSTPYKRALTDAEGISLMQTCIDLGLESMHIESKIGKRKQTVMLGCFAPNPVE